jgi:hypothetical protein
MKAAFFLHGKDISVLIPLISDVIHISSRKECNFSRSEKSFFKTSVYFFTGIEDPLFTIRVGSDIGYLDIPLSGVVDQSSPIKSYSLALRRPTKAHPNQRNEHP